MAPGEPAKQLLDAFKSNLLNQRVKLVCNYCANSFALWLGDEFQRVQCPHCSSTQATLEEYKRVIAKSSQKANETLEKKTEPKAFEVKRGSERKRAKTVDDASSLSKEEARQLAEARRVESLISAYGKKALIALSTYGIGPENAARILSRLRDDEEAFYLDLLGQQKQFIATRKYWRA
jgi:glutaredoxin